MCSDTGAFCRDKAHFFPFFADVRLSTPSLCLGLLLLASCARASVLPPDEVLKRAVVASGQLQSSSFDVSIAFTADSPSMKGSGSAQLKGVLQDGGHAVGFALTAKGSLTQGGKDFTADISADVASDRDRQTFFRINKLNFVPAFPLLSDETLTRLLGQWWKSAPGAPGPAVSVSPDPGLLRAQSEVIRVTRDHGIVPLGDGEAYFYDVSLDQEKMMAFLQKMAEQNSAPFDAKAARASLQGYNAAGQVWIDDDSFLIQKVVWTVGPVENGTAPFLFTINAVLSEQNAAKPVQFPTDAKIFPGVQPFMLTSPETSSSSSTPVR